MYFDDVLVYSKYLDEHILHLKSVFDVLRKEKLHANIEICSFGVDKVVFTELVLRSKGIEVDKSKITVIKDWPTTKTVGKFWSFHRLEVFIRGSSKDLVLFHPP